MEILQALQEMIKVHGWAGTAATLGMTHAALQSRVYELKGSLGLHVRTAMLIQEHSGTTLFAQAVARASGGVFVELPEAGEIGGEDLEDKFHELHGQLGDLSKTYRAAIRDNEIDKGERTDIQAIAQSIHKTMQELTAVMFQVYCKPGEQ